MPGNVARPVLEWRRREATPPPTMTLCRQTGRAPARPWHQCGGAQRRLPGADPGLVVRSQHHYALRRPGPAGAPAFGVTGDRLHADTTSFSVHGQYPASHSGRGRRRRRGRPRGKEDQELPTIIQVTYGYSRDHREDLKQWMLALITSGDGVPQFLRPLDGQASDKRALLDAVMTLTDSSRPAERRLGYMWPTADSTADNMTTLNAAGVPWASRVPETTTAAQSMVREEPRPGRPARKGRGTGGAGWSTSRKAGNAGSWCAPGGRGAGPATVQRQADARPGELDQAPVASGERGLCLSSRCRGGPGQGPAALPRVGAGPVGG